MRAVSPSGRGLGGEWVARAMSSAVPAWLHARSRLIVLALLAAVVPAACGGGGSSHSSSRASGGAAIASATSSTSTAPAKPLPPPTHTSCREVVYIGDSTSDGEALASYVPNRRLRAPAQFFKVGVKTTHMEVSGARSIVETFEGLPNAATVAQQLIAQGYHGCWIIAMGTNDAADVAAGSAVGLKTRIHRMMQIIGDQPVMWVNVLTRPGAPQYYEESGMRQWDRDLLAACQKYPQMRVFDWAAKAKPRWFIPDGVHYTTAGYERRTHLIAHGLVRAFPRGRPPSASCLVR